MVTKKKTDRLEDKLKKHHITEAELDSVIESSKISRSRTAVLPISREHIKFGYFSDPHIGHKEFREDGFDKARRFFKEEKVDFIAVPGDHLEGMTSIPGHIYELSHIGFQNQINYAASLYNTLDKPIYGIDGNHDERYYNKNDAGVIVGEELEKRVKNYKHLGQMEGHIKLGNNSDIMLFHPNDRSAFTPGYKLQKLCDSFTGGDKSSIVLQGHYHKAHYMFYRNIHAYDCGTLSGQSKFMKGKKIQAHMGFGVVDAYLDKNGVERVINTFVPLYSKERESVKFRKR